MADEREDLPTFDEFGDIVETIQTDQEGLDYSQPRKWIGPKFRGRPPEIKGEEYADLRTLDEIIAAGTAERSQDINVLTSVTGGLLSGLVKIPYGFLSLTTEIADALKEDNIKLSEGYAAKLEKTFKNSVLGKLTGAAEEAARDTAVGALTEMFTQLYGAARMGASGVVKAGVKAKKIANSYINAAKADKLVTPNKNIFEAQLKVIKMNQLSGKQKFSAVAIGGGAGTAMVTDIETIGSWGDKFGGPTKLDRQIKPGAKDDALRKLANRFRVGVEDTMISVPIMYGVGKIAEALSTRGKDLAYSNSEIDQLVDKYIGAPFRARSNKSSELYEGLKRVEGQIASSQVTAKDLIMDIDKTLFKIADEAKIGKGTPEIKRLVGRLDELITSGDDIVKNGKLVFTSFPAKQLDQFTNFAKEIGLNGNQVNSLVGEMMKVRNQFNVFKNTLLNGGNITAASNEFGKIMSERMRNIFTSEYKIFTDDSIIPFFRYKPTAEAMDQLKGMFKRYGLENGVKLDDVELTIMANNVVKRGNLKQNPLTKTPEFIVSRLSILDDKQSQLVNIADNIVGGKFKPTDFVKTEADLRQLQRLFGQKRDIRSTIVNTMQDLGTLAAKDEFYQNMLKTSDDMIKQGERGIAYPTRIEAEKAFPNKTVIADPGLEIQSALKEDVWANPINGRFTTTEYDDALKFTETLLMDNIAKNVVYQHLILIPKGITQINKTILGQFAHTRNFATSALFSLGTGNLTKNPITSLRNFRKAWNTIQPQLLYRNTPKDQRFYKFLSDENVVTSNVNASEIAGMLDDMGKGGDMYTRIFSKFGKAVEKKYDKMRLPSFLKSLSPKKLYDKALNLYVAEDDFWKVFNVLQENDTYTNAYKAAFKKGTIDKMPTELELLRMATKIVRDTVPNYSRVGDFVRNMRKTPFSNFVAFPAEVTRASGNIYSLGLQESADPVLSYVGKRRLISFAATVGGIIPTTNHILRGLYGGTEEVEAAIRTLSLAPYATGTSLFITRDKDGTWKYIDASGAFVYDTVTNPIQAVIAQTAQDRTFKPGTPLKVSVFDGLAQGFKRFIAPYFEPSIWYETMLSLYARNGQTPDGNSLWNPEAPEGEKFSKAFDYTVKNMAPFSKQQMERLILSLQNKPNERGQKFDIYDELAGMYGLRAIKVEPEKNIEFKIYEFKKGIRNTRGLLTGETLKGGEISSNDIIKRYIVANAQRYKVMDKMANEIEAGYTLDMSAESMRKEFDERQERNAFNKIARGYFYPFEISKPIEKKYKEQYQKLEDNFDNLTFDEPYDDATKDVIRELRNVMKDIPLGADFYDYINPKDWMFDDRQGSLPGASSEKQVTQVPPLAPQPMPNPQIISPPMPQMSQLNQGLTPTENALLSDSEKQIRLQHRGLS
jgi:hypothetical protein